MSSEVFQLHAEISGRVQGVGFRLTTRRVAEGFEVTGWVRNLEDGRVELHAEGEEMEVRTFIAAVGEAMRGFIRRIDTRTSVGPRTCTGFAIR